MTHPQISQEKLLEHLDKISARLATNSTFDIFDQDDIRQEIYLLLIKAYEKYDSSRGDEFSFLYNFVRYRLRTFKRDRFINGALKNSMDRLKIQRASSINEDSSITNTDPCEEIDKSEYFTKVVDSKIPAYLRMDYLRLLDGVEIQYHNKFKLMESIRVIVRANNDKQK